MKNKAYFIKRLAQIRGLDTESDEVKSWSSMSILDLLTAIKNEKGNSYDSDEDDISILARVLKKQDA
jgi:hypothetical protein